jgi:predicted nucleic acid-binding protein
MIVLDTNVVVRLMVGDDPKQARLAQSLIEQHACVIDLCVLMETEWVLRGVYGLATSQIAASLRALGSVQNIHWREPQRVLAALDAYEAGLDLADAIHASACREADVLATFDTRFAKRATKLGVAAMRTVAEVTRS